MAFVPGSLRAPGVCARWPRAHLPVLEKRRSRGMAYPVELTRCLLGTSCRPGTVLGAGVHREARQVLQNQPSFQFLREPC